MRALSRPYNHFLAMFADALLRNGFRFALSIAARNIIGQAQGLRTTTWPNRDYTAQLKWMGKACEFACDSADLRRADSFVGRHYS